jgi:hypothetical protein
LINIFFNLDLNLDLALNLPENPEGLAKEILTNILPNNRDGHAIQG